MHSLYHSLWTFRCIHSLRYSVAGHARAHSRIATAIGMAVLRLCSNSCRVRCRSDNDGQRGRIVEGGAKAAKAQPRCRPGERSRLIDALWAGTWVREPSLLLSAENADLCEFLEASTVDGRDVRYRSLKANGVRGTDGNGSRWEAVLTALTR
eukprot:6184709-Pleurochrysis_carterae.AAC.2